MNNFSYSIATVQRWLKPLGLLLAALCALPAAHADFPLPEDILFLAGFEGDRIDPLFPIVNGEFVLPPGPAADQLTWLLGELAVGENTTLAEVQAHFSPTFDAASIRDFINDVLRPEFPNAIITDLISLTPVRATVVIDGDSGPATSGFMQFGAFYSGENLINFIQVSNFTGEVQFPSDQNLTLSEAADKFVSLYPDSALFIGYIDNNDQCQPIETREPDTARALGSIFKMWILGAVASDMEAGLVNATDPITLVADERAVAGVINSEPLGSVFPVLDMAVLMMGISDNTATDHLHELIGRELAGMVVQLYGVSDPDLLLPFLNISEQFHLFTRFDLPTAQSYVNGTETFQQQFLIDEIEPEGPSFPINFPFFHDSLLSTGTWQASATDICRTLAGLRGTTENNGAFDLVNQAMGASSAQVNVRNVWDRVWAKGGSLVSGTSGTHVLTNAWLLENNGDLPPFVVVALANNSSGGIDAFEHQSITSRILELVREFQPWP